MESLTELQKQVVLGAFFTSIFTCVLISVIIYILLIIAMWKIFKKFGEPGWKSLIPIYNLYIMYKYSWNAKAFWRYIIVAVCTFVFLTVNVRNFGLPESVSNVVTLCVLGLSVVGIIWQFVMSIKIKFYISNAFGHGLPYGFGLLFFPGIFHLVIGFGKSEYAKAQ